MARNLDEKPRKGIEYVTRWVGDPINGWLEKVPVDTNKGVDGKTDYDHLDEDSFIRMLEGPDDILSEASVDTNNIFEELKFAINQVITNPQVVAILPPNWRQDSDIKYKIAQLVQKHYGYPADEVVKLI